MAAVRKSAQKAPEMTLEEAIAELEGLVADEKEPSEKLKAAVGMLTGLLRALPETRAKVAAMLKQLRKAFGITPSSEKRKKSGDPIGATSESGDPRPKCKIERLRQKIAQIERMTKDRRKKSRNLLRKLKRELMKLTANDNSDDDLTPEEEAELEEELEKEHEEYMKHLRLGDGEDPSLKTPSESFMNGAAVQIESEVAKAKVDPSLIGDMNIVSRMIDERTRYDFGFTLTEVTVEVEKVVVKDGDSFTQIISASTADIGPPKMDITWEFASNISILIAQYAFPFNRLASFIRTPDKSFTSGRLSGIFAYVADRLCPIYLHYFKQLANAEIIAGDDTKTRVNEFNRFMQAVKDEEKIPAEAPWSDYRTAEIATETLKSAASPSLSIQCASKLGFEFTRKDGNGPKKAMQTTLMWGRSDSSDPESTIIFYRSHIGSFGNLLSICLANRRLDLKDLVIQSDLSSSNLISDPDLKQRLNTTYAGCASHARRPFAIHEDDSPEICELMLGLFQSLYLYEEALDLQGRNRSNVTAVRGNDSRDIWKQILEVANIIAEKWSKKSALGEAAWYIIRHFKELTAYLDNPKLSICNNFSERLLRMERLIQANSLFRASLEGRFALDINRTIMQTTIAANVNLQEYLGWVLRSDPDEIEQYPERFTALAFSKSYD